MIERDRTRNTEGPNTKLAKISDDVMKRIGQKKVPSEEE